MIILFSRFNFEYVTKFCLYDDILNHVPKPSSVKYFDLQGMPTAGINLTLSHHLSLLGISPGRLSRQHPVSDECKFLLVEQPSTMNRDVTQGQ